MAKQQRQTTAGQQTKKTVRIPLAGNAQQRSTDLDKDQRFINYVIETSKNTVTDSKKLFCVKRPGTVEYSNPAVGAAAGRGVWYFNGAVWSVFGSTLYKGTTSKQTLSTATGMCGAVEFVNNDDFGRQGLFLADGTDAWIIDSSDTVTRVDNKHLQWASNTIYEVGDRIVPTVLDTYYYVCTTAGTTGASQPTWAATNLNDGTVDWERGGTYTGPLRWQASYAYAVDDLVIPTTGNENGSWYKVTVTDGLSGVTEPTWPIDAIGSTVSTDGVTYEYMGDYGGFPTPHIPTPAFMDGYLFLPETSSLDVYNSSVSAPFSWSALNFASAESYPDPIVGLARQNNFVVAFGTESTEFMYNYAKANQITDFDSPLDRHESMVLQTGCLNKNAVLGAERILVFIGDSLMGGHAVWRLDGSNAKEISTEYIEKFIDLEDTTTAITGFGIRIMGHMLFIVNLPTANKTFVYDLEENMWTEWQYNGGMLPFVSFCDADGIVVLQHSTNGKLYKLDPLVYNDFDVDIEARIRLAKQDFDTDVYKFYHQTTVIGDKATHAYVLRWSDADYTTWSNDKTLSVGNRPYFMRSGKARRRAWEIEYIHNSASRLESLEITYSLGDH